MKFSDAVKIFKSKGYKVITKYEDSDIIQERFSIKVVCPKGHHILKSVFSVENDVKCNICQNEEKFIELKLYVQRRGYQLKTESYINVKNTIHLICPLEHDFYVTINTFKKGSDCGCFASFAKLYKLIKKRKREQSDEPNKGGDGNGNEFTTSKVLNSDPNHFQNPVENPEFSVENH